jgi:hypothetical protein
VRISDVFDGKEWGVSLFSATQWVLLQLLGLWAIFGLYLGKVDSSLSIWALVVFSVAFLMFFFSSKYLPVFSLLLIVTVLGVFYSIGLALGVVVFGLALAGLLSSGISHFVKLALILVLLGLGLVFIGLSDASYTSFVSFLMATLLLRTLFLQFQKRQVGASPFLFKEAIFNLGILPNFILLFFPVYSLYAFPWPFDSSRRKWVYYRRAISFGFRGLLFLLVYQGLLIFMEYRPDFFTKEGYFLLPVLGHFFLVFKFLGYLYLGLGFLGFLTLPVNSPKLNGSSFLHWARFSKDFFGPTFAQLILKKGQSPWRRGLWYGFLFYVFYSTFWFFVFQQWAFSLPQFAFFFFWGVLFSLEKPLGLSMGKYSFNQSFLGLLGRSFFTTLVFLSTALVFYLGSFSSTEAVIQYLYELCHSWEHWDLEFYVFIVLFLFFCTHLMMDRYFVTKLSSKWLHILKSLARLIVVSGLLVVHFLQVGSSNSVLGVFQNRSWEVFQLFENNTSNSERQGSFFSALVSGNPYFSSLSSEARPLGGRYRFSEGAEVVEDIRSLVHKPSTSFLFKGEPFSINRWGIRGRDYEKRKNPGVIRIAVLGGSYVVGSGVGDNDVFSVQAEQLLNTVSRETVFEIWNFGNAGYDLIQSLYDFEQKNLDSLQFDALIVFSHGIDVYKNVKTLSNAYANEIPLPYPFLQEIFDTLQINKDLNENEIFSLLHPLGFDIVENLYAQLYSYCVENKIQPFWIHWPMTIRSVYIAYQDDLLMDKVGKLGFQTANFEDLYRHVDADKISVSEKDRHPSVLGHSLMADTLSTWILKESNLRLMINQEAPSHE